MLGSSSSNDTEPDIAAFCGVFESRATWLALTGAGISTASGIPDYRDVQGAWKRSPPIHYKPFMQDAAMRSRYWARSMVGWRFFRSVVPNAAHYRLAQLQQQQRVGLVVTQNVDGLHQQAGSTAVLDLHGRLDAVRCMDCGLRLPRSDYQRALEQLNPSWLNAEAAAAPDGDADLLADDFASFIPASCPNCAGLCKPDVVFYGENVPRERHEQASAALTQADGLLVLGSSLMVQSSYRYAQLAVQQGKPLLIANLGVTRADALATQKLSLPLELVLDQLLLPCARA